MGKTITAQDLDLSLAKDDEAGLFSWLLASFLMGKRINAAIAAEAYRVIAINHQRNTPRKLAQCTHRQLVVMLNEAHYSRYDESTAERLLLLANKLNSDYGGKVSHIRAHSANRDAFEQRLFDFKGIGPKTVEIFMREAGPVLY